jgi:hypothetical protein
MLHNVVLFYTSTKVVAVYKYYLFLNKTLYNEAVVFHQSADWMPLNNVFLLLASSGPQRETIVDASVVL